MLRICRSCVCPLLLLNLNQSWTPANLNHWFGIMGETGNAIHTCHDIASQFQCLNYLWPCVSDFYLQMTGRKHLNRLRKHFTTDTSLVLWLLSWEMEGLQSHSTDMNSHSMNSSKIPKCPLKRLMKIHSAVLELSYTS